MNRNHDRRWNDVITAARQLIPRGIDDLLVCDIATGIDPFFAGLHRYLTTTHQAEQRFYSATMHVTYPHHQLHRPRADRVTTMVLPKPPNPNVYDDWAVVHEFGHVMHGQLRFLKMPIEPVTSYAASDRYEAFAEAFTSWCLHQAGFERHGHYATPDRRFIHLMDALAARGS